LLLTTDMVVFRRMVDTEVSRCNWPLGVTSALKHTVPKPSGFQRWVLM